MFCHKCGTQIADGAAFCYKCGTKVVYEDIDFRKSDLPQGSELMGTPISKSVETTTPTVEMTPQPEPRQSSVWEPCAKEESGQSSVELVVTCAKLKGFFPGSVFPLLVDNVQVGELPNNSTFTSRIVPGSHQVKIGLICIEINVPEDVAAVTLHFQYSQDKSSLEFVCDQDQLVTEPSHMEKKRVEKKSLRSTVGEFKNLPTFQKFFYILSCLAVVFLAVFILYIFYSLPLLLIPICLLVCYWIMYRSTKKKYEMYAENLCLPNEITNRDFLETLSGKFNYPYFQGIRYGNNGECIIDGRYSSYTVAIGDHAPSILSITSATDEKPERTALLEGIAICSYINKFFNPEAAVDVEGNLKALKTADKREKIYKIVSTAVSVLCAVIVVIGFIAPDSLMQFVKPGSEVREAYLSQFSNTVTIEDAFNNFFGNGKWDTYKENDYSYVVFTGTCEYFGERSDVKITFKITGENFLVEHLDVNGTTQNDLMLYGLLMKVYEDY